MIKKIVLFIIFILLACMTVGAAPTPYHTATYTGTGIPTVNNSHFIFNLWLYENAAPASNTDVEIVLSNFSYVGTNRTDGGNPAGSFEWSGYTWTKRNDTLSSPGPCYWNSSNIWVDGDNKLHLRIHKVGSTWQCAELDSADTFGYGTFTVTVESELNFDPSIVLGIFTYTNDTNEIDIEFAKWGDSSFGNFQYSVQPTLVDHGTINLDGYNETTQRIIWMPSYVKFDSYYGTFDSYTSSTITPLTTTFNNVTGTGEIQFLDIPDSSPQNVSIEIPGATFIEGAPTANMVGFWPMNGTANDYNSGTKHHGTVYGTLTYNALGAYFDGSDYVTHTDMATPVWIAFDLNTTQREQDLVSHWGWSSQYSYILCEAADGQLILVVSSTGNTSTELYTTAYVENNVEAHYDMIFYNNYVKLYKDGTLCLNYNLGASLYNSNSIYTFGMAQYFANLVGYMHDIRYYSANPTTADLIQLLNNGIGVSYKAQPYGDWHLYTGTETNITDFGDMLSGISYRDTGLDTYDVSVTRIYESQQLLPNGTTVVHDKNGALSKSLNISFVPTTSGQTVSIPYYTNESYVYTKLVSNGAGATVSSNATHLLISDTTENTTTLYYNVTAIRTSTVTQDATYFIATIIIGGAAVHVFRKRKV